MAIKPLSSNETSFKIKVADRDPSKPAWFGEFRCLRRLSHSAQLQKDRLRREHLGAHPEHASLRAKEQSEIFSDLAVSLTMAPKWWVASGNGLDLDQDDIIAAVWGEVMKAQSMAEKEFETKSEEDAVELKKAVERGEAEEDLPDDK
jgi:hypothetical protein